MLGHFLAAGVFVSLLFAVAARNEEYRRFLDHIVIVSSNSNQGCDCNKASTSCVCVHGTCTSLGHDTHRCQCAGNWDGEMCDIAKELSNHAVPTQVPQSSSASTHLTINAITTTWVQPTSHHHTDLSTSATFYTCNKISALTAVAKGESIASSRVPAGSCPNSGAHSANELVYQLCQVPEHWHQGSNVLELCKRDAIPEYSPLAVFENDAINDAGIFVACLQDGFQMIQQTCDHPPRILRMTADNPQTRRFFTVL